MKLASVFIKLKFSATHAFILATKPLFVGTNRIKANMPIKTLKSHFLLHQ